ncbi:IclR family transcriptional regulator [Cohnella soli]|uniref:IclR family transcriptional regulator n=1 Tax=Cohnella soli TaxID=425005 RepID=A0ABW0HXA6_9BACL
MDNKYWVPAIEKADAVLADIAREPGKLRLIDLSKRTGINKSSLFSLLNTLEKLNWIRKDKDDTFRIGPGLGTFAGGYFKEHNLIASFRLEAPGTAAAVEESIQLAELVGSDVLYLAKEEFPGLVRLTTEPGMRLPAHTTALGKVLLSFLTDEKIKGLYSSVSFQLATPNTISNLSMLIEALHQVREAGVGEDNEEAVQGICCIAMPIIRGGQAVAAVSCSMLKHRWETKKELVLQELKALAARLS